MRSGFASLAPFLPSERSAETEGREEGGERRRRVCDLALPAAAAAAATAAQPAECASLWRGHGASPGASLPRRRPRTCERACVRACACAPLPVPSWFRPQSRLLPCLGESGRSGFDWRPEKPGGGGTEFRVSKGARGRKRDAYVTDKSSQSEKAEGRQRVSEVAARERARL